MTVFTTIRLFMIIKATKNTFNPQIKLFIFCISILLVLNLFPLRATAQDRQCVILLHGLARTSSSMETMAEALDKAGFKVVNQNYPSRDDSVENLAPPAINSAIEECKDNTPISFVTHSMGGILLRQYLVDTPIPSLGRVVMLGPPNRGSEVVDKLSDIPGFHTINGDAGLQLGTGELSLPNQLGPANFEVGIIAGSRSINLILSTLIPGQDDGKVAVKNTQLDGMDDHIVLPVTHTFMMKNSEVIKQTIHYLKAGEFLRDSGTEPDSVPTKK